MKYFDANGVEITVNAAAEITIACGAVKHGKVIQLNDEQVTLRCEVTGQNPDGILYGGEHNKVRIINSA